MGTALTLRRYRVLAAAVVGSLGGIYSSANAATFIWTGPTGSGGTTAIPVSGNWSDTTAWSPSIAVSAATTELDFNGSGGTAYTATDDVAGDFQINILKLNSSDTAVTETIAGASAANRINLVNNGATGATINQAGAGNFNLTVGLLLTGTSAVTLSGAGAGSVGLSGVIAGAAPLTISGGKYNFSGSAANTFTGATTISGGTVTINSSAVAIASGALTLSGGALNLNATVEAVSGNVTVSGGTLTYQANDQIVNSKTVTVSNGTFALGAFNDTVAGLTVSGGTLSSTTGVLTPSSTTATGGTISAIIGGAGALTKNGSGTTTVTGVNTLSGATTVNNGTLLLNGNGSLASSSGVTIGSAVNGTLTIDNTATNVGDRLKDTGNVTFANTGGTLNYTGNTASSAETIGALGTTGGIGNVKVTSASGASAQLNASALSHTNGALDFAGAGGTLGTAGNAPRVLFGTAPSLTGGIVGGWATVGGSDFATYDATNGVTAFAGYTDLPTSGFSGTTVYQATGDVALTGGGNLLALKLNAAANQTIDLGANNVSVDGGGIIKTGGTGTTTVNGTGTLTLPGEGVLYVNQGTLVVNAPLNTPRLTKPGAGKLTLPVTGAAGWMTNPVNFAGTLELNTSSDQTITGQMGGPGTLVKSGLSTLTLSNQNNGFTNFAVNGGILEAKSIAASQNVVFDAAATQSYLGNNTGGAITLNGGTVKLTTVLGGSGGTVAGNITLGRTVSVGALGGVVDLTNTVGGTLGGGVVTVNGHSVGGGSGNLPVTFAAASTAPLIVKFNGGESGLSSNAPAGTAAPSGDWGQGNNGLRFGTITGATATTPLRVELTHGAIMDLLTLNNFAGPLTIQGQPNGDAGGSSLSLNNGKVALGGTVTLPQPLNVQGAIQIGATGAGQILDSSITVNGTASGIPGILALTGRGTGSGNPGTAQANVLDIGTFNAAGSNRTLLIQDGGTAILDARVRTDVTSQNPVRLNASTTIAAGGLLQFKQSYLFSATNTTSNNTGFHEVLGDITANGTTAKESTIEISLRVRGSGDAATSLGAYNFGISGPNGADLIVNGSGFGGLKILGRNNTAKIYTANNPTNEASLPTLTAANEGFTNVQKLLGSAAFSANSTNIAALAPARLANLKGTGGFLTIGADNETVPFPAGGEWAAAVPVGLRTSNSNTSGPDVSLPTGGTWNHNLHVDVGAELVAAAVSVTGALNKVSGSGTITSGVGANGFTVGATLTPGAAGAGILTSNGDITLASGSTYVPELNGLTAGTGYDQLNVVGQVTLDAGGNALLSPTLGYDPTPGDALAIVLNDGADAVAGNFAGLTEGAPIVLTNAATGHQFTFNISYQGNADGGTVGNDVVLTAAVPEPSTIAGIALAGGAMLARRRRRK